MLPRIVVLTHLLNFLLTITFGRLVNWKQLSLPVVGSMVALLLVTVRYFSEILGSAVYAATLGSWVSSGLFEVNWVFSIDALTYTMLLVVLTVSILVHIYSTEYMREDPYTARFISYLFLLTLFTMLFIISDNFVGFAACSFFLTRPYSSQRSNLLRLMGTTPDRSAPQKGDSTSLAVPGASSQTSLEVAVPPFSAYKHLLIGRSKHPLLYDKDAKGFLGWWRNLGRPRPTAPYQWENTGRVVVIGDAYVWVTDISLSKLDTKVYFVSVNEGPVVCGAVIKLTPHLRLVSVPLGHTIHKQDFVTTDRPHGFTETP